MNRPLFIAIIGIGIAVLAAAIGLNFFLTDRDAGDKKTAAPEQAPAAPEAPPSASPEKPLTAPDLAQRPIAPSFDIVRINPAGDTVIAGRAAPGAEVTILDGGKVIGKVTADKRGEWVLVPDKPLPPGARRLSLSAKLADKLPVTSESEVVLVVPEKGKDIAGRPVEKPSAPLALKVPRERPPPATGKGGTAIAEATPPAGAPAAPPERTVSPVPPAEKPSASPAPEVAREGVPPAAGKGGAAIAEAVPPAGAPAAPPEPTVSPAPPAAGAPAAPPASIVLQAPPTRATPGEAESKAGKRAPGTLAINVIDYDEKGRVTISGTAVPGARLRIYLDNRLVGTAEADAKGVWRFSPDMPLSPGAYALRVDQVKPGGRVIARVEIPFTRAAALLDLPRDAVVVVQPGNSLWRIARRTFGRGIQYTVIYEANRDQIRDPDLIYPGQIFALPPVSRVN
ncbi:MAG: LysM peptidoglycan-binding domain-containing protein [Alphaproteobacteria bacterium]